MAEQVNVTSRIGGHLSEALQSPRNRWFGKWFAIAFASVGVLGFFAAPPLLKSVLQKELSKELAREVVIGDIDINPYALTARVAGVTIRDGEQKEVAGFDELFINLSSSSIFKMAAVVDEARLQGLRLNVVRLEEGKYDISDLIEKWSQPKEEPDTGTPRFSVNNIQLLDSKIVFDDRPKGEVHTIENIKLGIPFVSSLPYQADIVVQPSFSARIDGSELALDGQSKPFSPTHESQINLDIDHFDLSVLKPYLPASLPFRLHAGVLDSELKAVFKESEDQVFSLAIVGSTHVSHLVVNESDGRPLLAWKRLDIDVDNIDPVNRLFALRRIGLTGPEVTLAVDKRGELNLQRVANRLARAPAAPPEPNAKPAPAPVWSLGEFAISEGGIHWRDESDGHLQEARVHDLRVQVEKIDSKLAEPIKVSEVSARLDAGDALKIGKLAVHGMQVDLEKHHVDIHTLSGAEFRGKMSRNKEGKIAWLMPPLLKESASANSSKPNQQAKPAKAGSDKPWIGELATLKIDDVGFRFEDQSSTPAMVQELSGFSLHGEGLSNAPGKKGALALKGKINQKGSLDISGKVQLSPLDASLQMETVAVPLMPLQPYFADYLNVALTRGQLSNKGEATVSQSEDKLKATYKGSLTLGDFLAVDKLNSTDFLKWKSLYFGGIDFRLDPLAVNIGEIALSDFYSRLILNEAGHLNVADIVRKPAQPDTPSAQASAKVDAGKPASPPPPIKIAKITLQNGTVNFSDFFVKPNYSVNLTRLGGRVTGLSSAENSLADLDLRGSYANSAPVQILAKLNPLAAKSYLDLNASVTGVDLVGFSPYSGKYAGYAIEKGKLSLNVAYKLENGKLNADNKLFIDQFTFGNKVDSPDATKLPVNLAISLLKNNRGEIDLNLPIAGSLDDPQFSVGGLILKVIGNLFVKAVTSPFALLGSMFGGGEELSNIEFKPGYTAFDATASKRLEMLSKALTERDSLKLEITGHADPEVDRDGIRRAAIERAMKAEKLKDMTKKGGEGVSLDDITIEPDEYKTYLTRAYKEAKFPKPRNVIGMHKELPQEEMEKLMLTNMPATDEDVRALAIRRAEAVQSWLVEQGKVSPGRVFLLPPKTEVDREAKASASRVDFSLK